MMRHLHTENLRAYKPTSRSNRRHLSEDYCTPMKEAGRSSNIASSLYTFYQPLLQMTVSLRLGVFELLLPVFFRATLATAILVAVVCLSVRLLQVGVLLKWLNVGLRKQRHTTDYRDSSFSFGKISAKIKRIRPQRGR